MITSILNAIQTDSNLFLLLRTMIGNNIGNVTTQQLQAMMTVLGLPYN